MLPNLLLHPLSAIETLFLENNKVRDSALGGFTLLWPNKGSQTACKALVEVCLLIFQTLYISSPSQIKVMPDDWFSRKMEVPYLYLSANPWACDCSLGYLRTYLEDYEFNIYTRDGLEIRSDAEGVVSTTNCCQTLNTGGTICIVHVKMFCAIRPDLFVYIATLLTTVGYHFYLLVTQI